MKKVTRGFGDDVNCYQESDLDGHGFRQAVTQATEMWRDKMEEYFKANGDRGCAVLGAGIYIHFLPKGKRKPDKLCIINPQPISPAQGECTWSGSAKDVVAFLKTKGIHSWFECGRMD